MPPTPGQIAYETFIKASAEKMTETAAEAETINGEVLDEVPFDSLPPDFREVWEKVGELGCPPAEITTAADTRWLYEPVPRSHGEVAYGLYADQVGGKTWDGKPMPTWDNLSEKIQSGWSAAAYAALPHIDERSFNPDELHMISFCQNRQANYPSVPVPGSGLIALVDKLVKLIEGE